MIELLYDCDLTMGLADRDVDDGLALMALLGLPEVRLLGVTSTFGNGTLEEVHPCLEATLRTLGAADIPCFKGAASTELRSSPAAGFLADTAARLAARGRGGLRILATGALTNLHGAALQDPGFFANVAEVVVMGGVTAPLQIGGRVMKELNFACDPEAAHQVLQSGARVTVISGNLCLEGFLPRERLLEGLSGLPRTLQAFLTASLEPWVAWYRREYGLDGFHPWDAIAALYLTEPGLFDSRERFLLSDVADLRSGCLRTAAAASPGKHPRINLPARLRDPGKLHASLFAAWRRLGERLEQDPRALATGQPEGRQ